MFCEKAFHVVQAMRRRRSAILGVLLFGFGGAGMTGACGPSTPGTSASASSGGTSSPAAQCSENNEVPCMRYHIPLDGSPSTDVALQRKYIAAFGDACYISVANTFDCFYRKWQDACADAVKIAEVYGAAPYDKGYTCQPVVGTEDYTLQVGPDVANQITINYQAAPRQTPLIMVNGVPTEVSGPYRNLVEITAIEPGKDFEDDSGMLDADGFALTQRKWVLAVNRKNGKGKDGEKDGKIHSDLAGFAFPCKKGSPEICKEPDVLEEPPGYLDVKAEVHHVVPRQDKRCCPWGTSAYKNAAAISRKLNEHFTNDSPPEEEVTKLNNAAAHAP